MRRAVVSALTLVAFILRLMLMAMPMPEATAAGMLVPICTATGLQSRTLDLPKAPAEPAKKGGIDCPLCRIPQGLPVLPALVELPVPVAVAGTAAFSFHRAAPTLRLAARPPPSRGPPLLSSRETLTRA
ncbi:MAG: DUF2946 family protein [Rhodospirillales bacterium]|nr:DUF2946 family protein [Rhodospirillales bacterium]